VERDEAVAPRGAGGGEDTTQRQLAVEHVDALRAGGGGRGCSEQRGGEPCWRAGSDGPSSARQTVVA
jgi:hypothetical protein